MPEEPFSNAASELHRSVLRQIEALIKESGKAVTTAMNEVGSRSNWDFWRNGQSPKLTTLEDVVKKLGGRMTIAVTRSNAGSTIEGIEVASMVDTVHEPEVREQIAELVLGFVTKYAAAKAAASGKKTGP